MSRRRLLMLATTGFHTIVSNSRQSLQKLGEKVIPRSASHRQPDLHLEPNKSPSSFDKLKQFLRDAAATVANKSHSSLDAGYRKLKNKAGEGRSLEIPEQQQPVQEVSIPTVQDVQPEADQLDPTISQRASQITSKIAEAQNTNPDNQQVTTPNEGEHEESLTGPPVIVREYSFEQWQKPSFKLSVFLARTIRSLVDRQLKVNQTAYSRFHSARKAQLADHVNEQDERRSAYDSSVIKSEELRATATFPTAVQDDPMFGSKISMADSDIRTPKPAGSNHSRNKSEPQNFRFEARPQIEIEHVDEQEENQFVEYVNEERLSRLKHDVEELKRQHLLHTNYDASDEESLQPTRMPVYLDRRYKHKTEVSNNSVSRIFEPRIYVNEAPQKSISSTVNMIEKQWPVTEPKKKKKAASNYKDPIPASLMRTPTARNKGKHIGDSFEYDMARYAEKIIKLREARKVKLELQQKLDKINRQIRDIKNPEKNLEEIRKSHSPKNSLRQMISISDDKEARNKALTLVRKLKQQREKHEKVVSNIFSRVDKDVMESIAELNQVRLEQQRKSKQRRQLEVLERMREQEKRKYHQYRLEKESGVFIQALKQYENKNKPLQSKKSMAWIRPEDTPELAARKDLLEKLRNLSYVEKRSIIEEYNRELLRK